MATKSSNEIVSYEHAEGFAGVSSEKEFIGKLIDSSVFSMTKLKMMKD